MKIEPLTLTDRTMYYPYNETFHKYAEPRAGKRAQQFIDRENSYKGGVWVLHTKEQYDDWYARIGQHQEAFRFLSNS
jgi:hypothetical protein